MKYINTLVFLGLMVFVAGCQKQEKATANKAKKGSHHTSAHDAKLAHGKKESHPKKQGPTKLETKKSVAVKHDDKKKAMPAQAMADKKKAAVMKKAEPAKKMHASSSAQAMADKKKAKDNVKKSI